jgi:hypothetical protein
MANQKITDLNKLHQLEEDDLFIVVDTDSKTNSASPTGETKGISASSLATELTRIANNEVGIDLKNLRDVPDSYDEHKGGFIRINDSGTAIEFTDSPGASEQSFSGSSLETHDLGEMQEYGVGDLLISSGDTKFKKASCLSSESAEVIGIIKKLKYKPISDDSALLSSVIEKVNIVFNGLVKWEWNDDQIGGPLKIEKRTISQVDSLNYTEVYENQLLNPGQTYFLGKQGTLLDFEPADDPTISDSVSKPVLIATSPTSGVMVNYRGLMCSSDESANKFVIYEPASCNSIKIGDMLRIVRKKVRTGVDSLDHSSGFDENSLHEQILPSFIERESGIISDDKMNYALCNSASQLKSENPNDPFEDDNYGCDVLGIVINSSSDFFEIQTSGIVEFNLPLMETGNFTTEVDGSQTQETSPIERLFNEGYTYYIESFPLNDDQKADTNKPSELRNSVYDFSSEEIGQALTQEADGRFTNPLMNASLKPQLDGSRPFRNTTMVDPFKRDAVTGKVLSYSKPAFYALSSTKILILNHPAYPNPKDVCNAIDPTSGTPCATYDVRDTKNFSVSRSSAFTNQSDLEEFGNNFLKSAWPTAGINDKGIITYVIDTLISNNNVTLFETHEYVKIDSLTNANWNYLRRIS